MALKEAWNALIGKTEEKELVITEQSTDIDISELFPIVSIPETQMDKYQKIPMAGLAALGTAFSRLPEAARTIVQTTTSEVGLKETLFVGINPKGVPGYLIENQYGTVGNIMQINEQGKQVIAGRMRFKALDSLPLTETATTTIPYDPTLMVIAVAVMAIEQKLDKIQESVESVLQFLELEKQAKQRGNLRKIAEISNDYKLCCNDEAFCSSRANIVQNIQTAAYGDIEFYSEKVAEKLRQKKFLHLSKDTDSLVNSVLHEFAEYQLACYINSYCAFLDLMLRKNFSTDGINNVVSKLSAISVRYQELHSQCHSQIATYQRSAIENKVVGGAGIIATNLGKAIAAIPVIKEGPVDEALISAGKSLGKMNRDSVAEKLESLDAFEDDRSGMFIESLQRIDFIYNAENSIVTDGENLYMLCA